MWTESATELGEFTSVLSWVPKWNHVEETKAIYGWSLGILVIVLKCQVFNTALLKGLSYQNYDNTN
jgi:hypothetical protein